MGYNADNDKLIKLYEKNGEKKLQISRSYNKKDGTVGYGNAGRLTKIELEWLKNNIVDIMSNM